jgi:hypothetical protein
VSACESSRDSYFAPVIVNGSKRQTAEHQVGSASLTVSQADNHRRGFARLRTAPSDSRRTRPSTLPVTAMPPMTGAPSATDAWNRHDTDAFAKRFAEDADFVNVRGVRGSVATRFKKLTQLPTRRFLRTVN